MTRNRLILLTAGAALLCSSGWVYAFRAQERPQRYLMTMDRRCSNVLYFGDNTVAGQFCIESGEPVWKPEYLDAVKNKDQTPNGRRLRMGSNLWTTLESTLPLTIGGVDVPAGYYYLAWEKAAEGVNVVAFDAEELRKQAAIPFLPPQEGGIVIPMTLEETEDEAETLALDFVSERGKEEMTLEITWGPFRAHAPVIAQL